jgi:hypothetical protein
MLILIAIIVGLAIVSGVGLYLCMTEEPLSLDRDY